MRHLRSEAGDCELGELWRVVTEVAVDQDARPPLNAHLKDSRGSDAETQYSALGLPSVFLGFVIGHRCQVIGNSEVARWNHVIYASST
jgi:hypothetical protein